MADKTIDPIGEILDRIFATHIPVKEVNGAYVPNIPDRAEFVAALLAAIDGVRPEDRKTDLRFSTTGKTSLKQTEYERGMSYGIEVAYNAIHALFGESTK